MGNLCLIAEQVSVALFIFVKAVLATLFRRVILRRSMVPSWSVTLECAVVIARQLVGHEVQEKDITAYSKGPEARHVLARERERTTALKGRLFSRSAFPGCAVVPAAVENLRAEWYVPKCCASSCFGIIPPVTPEKERPVIMHIHGGAFVTGGLDMYRRYTSRLAVTLGMPVLGFEYRLMPQHRFKDILGDAVTVFGYLRDVLGYPPSRIILSGDSAGGHLVLSLALHLQGGGLEGPGAIVVLSPWVDPVSYYSEGGISEVGFKEFQHLDILGNAARMLQLGSFAFSEKDIYRSMLLPHNIQQAQYLPPCLIQVGDCEVFFPAISEFVREVHEITGLAGDTNKLRLEVFKDQVHGFHMLDDLTPATRPALASIARFLRSLDERC